MTVVTEQIAPGPPVAARLPELPRRGVRLLPGPFADRVRGAREVYAGIGVDRVLKGFRRRAGLPDPGEDLQGWASRTSEATFGQWVSGIARLSSFLDDGELRQQAVDLVDGWAQTLPADGNPRMVTYGWEKAVCGLVDAAIYAGHGGAMEVLTRTAAWARDGWDMSRTPASPGDRDGRAPSGTLEWYTLAENLYRGYEVSGEPLLRECAALWHYDSYWDAFTTAPPDGAWDVPVWLHAYSHVNTFASAAAAARVTGSAHLLDVARHGALWARSTQSYVTGAFGPGEWTVPQDGTLGRSLEWRSDTAEIPCDTWAVSKIAGYLLAATGDARHLDWAEDLLLNGLGAALPIQPDGQTYYYADYRLGAMCTKLYHWDAWPCCSGTYLQALAALHELIWSVDRAADGTTDGVRVGMFVPSEIAVATPAGPVTVRQEVAPLTSGTTVTVRTLRPVELTLRIRVPSWSRGVRVVSRTANGPVQTCVATPADAPADGWLTVRGTWNDGDGLDVSLGSGLRSVPVDPQHPRRVAFAFGPHVLAQDAVFSAPLPRLPDTHPEALDAAFAVPGAGGPSFVPRDRGDAEQPAGPLRPLTDYGFRTPHRVYHDLDEPRFL